MALLHGNTPGFAAALVCTLALGTPAHALDNDAAEAAIGGGLGGALGAVIGNEIGGENGAIVGGAIGAAGGTAIIMGGDADRNRARHEPRHRNRGWHGQRRHRGWDEDDWEERWEDD